MQIDINKLPWLISYPRSGSHWINNSIEVYTNRPKWRRGCSFLDKNNINYLYFHDHDINSTLKKTTNKKVMFVYRNPLDVLFSYSKTENKYDDINWIKLKYKEYLKNFNKWRDIADVTLKYEDLKMKKNWDIICDFFEIEYDYNKWENVWKKTTKENIIKLCDYRYMSKDLISKNYEYDRKTFKEKYSRILNIKNNN